MSSLGLSKTLFTIVTPFLPNEHLIFKAMESVRNQTSRVFEVVLVMDGQENDASLTSNLRKTWPNDIDLRILRNGKNLGAGGSRNKAIKVAAGEYLLFLDSDDHLQIDTIEKLVPIALKSPDVIFYGAHRRYSNEMIPKKTFVEKKRLRKFAKSEVPLPLELLDPQRLTLSSPAPWLRVVKRSVIAKHNIEFGETERANDVQFFIEALTLSSSFLVLNEALIEHQLGRQGSLASDKLKHSEARLTALDASVERLLSWNLSKLQTSSVLLFCAKNFFGAQLSLGNNLLESSKKLLSWETLWKFSKKKLNASEILLLLLVAAVS